jgi:hypothetical protein
VYRVYQVYRVYPPEVDRALPNTQLLPQMEALPFVAKLNKPQPNTAPGVCAVVQHWTECRCNASGFPATDHPGHTLPDTLETILGDRFWGARIKSGPRPLKGLLPSLSYTPNKKESRTRSITGVVRGTKRLLGSITKLGKTQQAAAEQATDFTP